MVRHDRSLCGGDPDQPPNLCTSKSANNFLQDLNSSDASGLPPSLSYSRGETSNPDRGTGYMFREYPWSILLFNVLLRAPKTSSAWRDSTTRRTMLFMLHHSRNWTNHKYASFTSYAWHATPSTLSSTVCGSGCCQKGTDCSTTDITETGSWQTRNRSTAV